MFRPRLRLPRRALRLGPALGPPAAANARRSLYAVPALSHEYPEGVPNLLSKDGFTIAWSQYMSLMVENVNERITGTELEDKEIKDILLRTARDPQKANIFNYASMAHNNHFFFDGISPTGSPMPTALCHELEASFSSLDTLRLEFVQTARAMFGPGFVWLVKAGPGDYRLLVTYLAGSPYPGAHWRRQSLDMSNLGNDGSAYDYMRNLSAASRKRAVERPPGGIELDPLLCLNTWEHVWLYDWGLGVGGRGGKVAFAESWWEIIDWEKVAHKTGVLRPDFKSAAIR